MTTDNNPDNDMGREVKRVALAFLWIENKVWGGYINPHYDQRRDCAHCGGRGSSLEALTMEAKWYGNAPFNPEDRGSTPFLPTHPVVWARAVRNVERSPEYYGSGESATHKEAHRLAEHFNKGWMHHLNADDVAALVEAGRLMDLTHTWTKATGWQPKAPAYMPTPQEVNGWSLSGMGHDSINQWVVIGAECKRLDVHELCRHCDGEGSHWESPEAKQRAEDWTPTEPPAGEGYQIWETVSEGSPISPVFATPEELAKYMAGRKWGADQGSSYDTWLRFINGPGWAPSFTMGAGGTKTGADAAF